MQQSPMAAGQMLLALDFHLGPVEEVAVVGQGGSEEVRRVVRAAREPFRPNRVLAFRDTDVVLGVAGVDPPALDDQANNAEPGAVRRMRLAVGGQRLLHDLGDAFALRLAQLQGLLDCRGGHVDEDEVAHVLDDERPAFVGKRQVHRPAGERDLRAGRVKDLVGRDDDPPVRLDADLELVALVGWCDSPRSLSVEAGYFSPYRFCSRVVSSRLVLTLAGGRLATTALPFS